MSEDKQHAENLGSSVGSSALPIYSEETIGRLLRRLNLICVKAAEADEVETARTAAAFSRSVEDAMKFAGIE